MPPCRFCDAKCRNLRYSEIHKSTSFHCTCRHYCNTAYVGYCPQQGHFDYRLVVGYAKNNMTDGFKAVSTMFTGVGTVVNGQKGIYISQLVVEGADTFTDKGGNIVQIQLLDGNGGSGDRVYGYHKGEATSGRGSYPEGDGWYNAGKEKLIGNKDIFLPEGMGLWVNGKSASFKIQSSGEVELDTVQKDLTSAFCLIANPYPTDIKISQIEITGADTFTDKGGNVVQIQILDENGSSGDRVYGYHKGEATSGRGSYPDGDGWYNAGKEKLVGDKDITIPAGTAMWVNGKSEDYKFKIITPFVDAE